MRSSGSCWRARRGRRSQVLPILPTTRCRPIPAIGRFTRSLPAKGAAAEAATFVIQKPLLARFGPVEFTTYAVWAATLMMLPAAPAAMHDLHQASAKSLAAGVYIGVVPTVFANVLWAVALSRLTASNAASSLYLLPAVAIAIAWCGSARSPRHARSSAAP